MLFMILLQAAAQQPLNLTCSGGGTANKVAVATAHSNASGYGMVGTVPISGSSNSSTNVYIPRQQGFSDQVDVRLFSGDDRVRMPRTMLPGLHGGKDGWFVLKDITGDERFIRATVAVNFINHPKLFIDRTTGTISISGKAGNYSGQCEVVDVEAKPKF